MLGTLSHAIGYLNTQDSGETSLTADGGIMASQEEKQPIRNNEEREGADRERSDWKQQKTATGGAGGGKVERQGNQRRTEGREHGM